MSICFVICELTYDDDCSLWHQLITTGKRNLAKGHITSTHSPLQSSRFTFPWWQWIHSCAAGARQMNTHLEVHYSRLACLLSNVLLTVGGISTQSNNSSLCPLNSSSQAVSWSIHLLCTIHLYAQCIDTVCDPIWHASSYSGEGLLHTANLYLTCIQHVAKGCIYALHALMWTCCRGYRFLGYLIFGLGGTVA